MRSLLILLFLPFSFATLTSQVEVDFSQLTKTIKGSPKIEGSGSQPAPPDMFPFYAILRKKGDFQALFCGGTIIDTHHILTAATCVRRMNESQIVVTVGTNRLNSGGTNYTVSKIIKHSGFDDPVNSTLNDIAILRINGSITFGPHVKAVIFYASWIVENPYFCPPAVNINKTTGPLNYPKGPGVFAGWTNSLELQYIQLPIVTYDECLQALNATGLKNFDVYVPHQVCTYKNHGQTGFCGVDRGGPLMFNGFQYGIASWGGPCMAGLPNVYTFVTCYLSWIKAMTII